MSKSCLIIKTSSLGDILHLMPSLTDLDQHFGESLTVDWVVESSFSQIVSWHPKVNSIIECNLRKWRHNPFKYRSQIKSFKLLLKNKKYDYIIDAQGLLKSAWIAKKSVGTIYGFDWSSAREPLASLLYNKKFKINKNQHATNRLRQLFANIFKYDFKKNIDFGLNFRWAKNIKQDKSIVFLHATTWKTKYWPLKNWQILADELTKKNIKILLPWGNETEKKQAFDIARDNVNIEVLPKKSLTEMVGFFMSVDAIVGCDTGLSHISAACGVPTIALYGSTNHKLAGVTGNNAINIQSSFHCSPCLKRTCKISNNTFSPCQENILPSQVLSALTKLNVI